MMRLVQRPRKERVGEPRAYLRIPLVGFAATCAWRGHTKVDTWAAPQCGKPREEGGDGGHQVYTAAAYACLFLLFPTAGGGPVRYP